MNNELEFTFVITGKYEYTHTSMIPELKKYGRVILSTYKSDALKIDYDLYDLVVLSSNKEMPSVGNNPYYPSIAYQSLLIHRGMNLSKSKYSVRLRTDMLISNVSYIINMIKHGNSDKLYVSNVSFTIDRPYQIGDHIIASSTENMKKTFNEMYNTCVTGDFLYDKLNRYHSTEVNIYGSFLKIKNQTMLYQNNYDWTWDIRYDYGDFRFFISNDRYDNTLIDNFEIIDYQYLEPFFLNGKLTSVNERKQNENLPCWSSIDRYKLKNLKLPPGSHQFLK